MHRYFFDLIDNGHRVPDDQGSVLKGIEEAQAHAALALLEFMVNRVGAKQGFTDTEGSGPLDVAILVREDGGPLLRVAARFLVEKLQ